MRYVLYSGAGNTFAFVDDPLSPEGVIALCEHADVDGVIFSERVFRMRIFNRDGSEAEMCGNGLRCFIKFLIEEKKVIKKRYPIETLGGLHTAWVNGENICVELPPPKEVRWNLQSGGYRLHHLNTGVPHAVLFVDSVEKIDLSMLGPLIRHDSLFPKGVNVNIVQLNPFRIRTFERGVERETLACGTGATASALAAAHLYALPSPIKIRVQSGDHLTLSFTPDWQSLNMEGPATRLREGYFSLKPQSPIL